MDITMYIDESGIIPVNGTDHNKYFVISIVTVCNENAKHVSTIFKRERLKIAKKSEKLYKSLVDNKEIKGSDMSESKKAQIYKPIIEKCSSEIEIGIIILDASKVTERFRSKCSRAFNYLLKLYLLNCFKKKSIFKNKCQSLKLVVDERNVATCSKHTLGEYLNSELNLTTKFCKEDCDIAVEYSDSKRYLLLQLSDFIANTFYRRYQKNINESGHNIELLRSNMCNGNIFSFPLE